MLPHEEGLKSACLALASRDGRILLTGPTAAAQPYRWELVFMPLSGHCPTIRID
jgi:hypothetical protein